MPGKLEELGVSADGVQSFWARSTLLGVLCKSGRFQHTWPFRGYIAGISVRVVLFTRGGSRGPSRYLQSSLGAGGWFQDPTQVPDAQDPSVRWHGIG